MSRRCALVATVPWLTLAALLTPRAMASIRSRLWRELDKIYDS